MGVAVGSDRQLLTVGVGGTGPSEDAMDGNTLSLSPDGDAYFSHGPVSAELHSSFNGSWRHLLPWGGVRAGVTAPSSPLLEASLPSQAGLLGVPSTFLVTPGANMSPSSLVLKTEVRQTGEWRHLETQYTVNDSSIASREWDGASRSSLMRNSYGEPLLQVAYSAQYRPASVVLATGLPAINISYDQFGRPSSLKWAGLGLHYGYGSEGLLSYVRGEDGGSTRYGYTDDGRLSSISLPSGRTWTLSYDEHGGLRSVSTPSGTSHVLSVQPTFSAFVFSYTAPGASQPYRQHLDPSGRLLMTAFPDNAAKILYTYTTAGQLQQIVSGDGQVTFTYGADGLLSEVANEEDDLEYKLDLLYEGRLLQELRTEYSARTGLSNIKFTYEYDSNMRITKMAGRIGGQKVKPLHIAYSPKTGEPTNIGNFLYARSQSNVTSIQDGTAIFTRNTDDHLRVTYVSLNIHNMQVFTQQISYDNSNRIAQTSTFTTSYLARPYTYTKNYTYDADGQLSSVSGKEPWSFSYDANGNMVSLTYSANTIPMQYDEQDKIIRFGEGVYKYNARGFIVQNAREVSYEYNSRGLLIRAVKPERFAINYLYDHERRLIARKDNFGNVTQFQYQDPRHPDRVTHIYNARDASLTSLVHDDRGHLIFAQVQRSQYYIATDQNGTPILLLNRFGEVAREMMRSPFGQIIYDSNPYLYLPVDYCGGIQDSQTELVHLPKGRVYDPLIGLWLSPQWEEAVGSLLQPNRPSLYRPNGNDPVNVRSHTWDANDKFNWLGLLSYDLSGLAPPLSWPPSAPLPPRPALLTSPSSLWEAFTLAPRAGSLPGAIGGRSARSPFEALVPLSGRCVSGMAEALREATTAALSLDTVRPSALREDFWPSLEAMEFSSVPGPFGDGLLVSRVQGRAAITATPLANPIFRDVIMSVFNNSYLLDVSLYSRAGYTFYFVKDELWRVKEDRTQLNRLAGEVNITQTTEDDKVIDVRLHTKYAVVHVRYGTNPRQEVKRLLKHVKKLTFRRAWADERDRLTRLEAGTVPWTHDQTVELITHGSVEQYTARYMHGPEQYPDLADDPSNVKFVKTNKRTRRNSRGRRLRRCWDGAPC